MSPVQIDTKGQKPFVYAIGTLVISINFEPQSHDRY